MSKYVYFSSKFGSNTQNNLHRRETVFNDSIFFFLAVPRGLQDLSSPTRD